MERSQVLSIEESLIKRHEKDVGLFKINVLADKETASPFYTGSRFIFQFFSFFFIHFFSFIFFLIWIRTCLIMLSPNSHISSRIRIVRSNYGHCTKYFLNSSFLFHFFKYYCLQSSDVVLKLGKSLTYKNFHFKHVNKDKNPLQTTATLIKGLSDYLSLDLLKMSFSTVCFINMS